VLEDRKRAPGSGWYAAKSPGCLTLCWWRGPWREREGRPGARYRLALPAPRRGGPATKRKRKHPAHRSEEARVSQREQSRSFYQRLLVRWVCLPRSCWNSCTDVVPPITKCMPKTEAYAVLFVGPLMEVLWMPLVQLEVLRYRPP